MKIINRIGIIFLTIFFSGCSLNQHSYTRYSKTDEAYSILRKIESINSDIRTSKGSGWITIADRKGQKKFRMAWASSFPDKIRLTLLSAGHPVETILADGNTVTFISHTGKHSIKKIKSSNPSLKDIVSIPVTIQDILSIFAGKVPIGKFDTAQIAQITYSPTLSDTMLILNRRWNGYFQHIVLNADNQVSSFSLLNENRKLIHSLFNEKYKVFDSFSIPIKVKIRDRESREITLEMTNYQPNVAIKPDIFILTESR